MKRGKSLSKKLGDVTIKNLSIADVKLEARRLKSQEIRCEIVKVASNYVSDVNDLLLISDVIYDFVRTGLRKSSMKLEQNIEAKKD